MEINHSTKKRYESAMKPDSCPACGSNKIASFMYGKPSSSERLKQKVAEGKIVFGGCCINVDNPTWKCMSCCTKIYHNKEKH
jgi:hypothetical protein